MSRPITVGLDGSPESLAAADWAADEAMRRRLPLHLVHAWMLPPQTARVAQEPEVRRQWSLHILREAEADLTARHPELAVSAEQAPDTAVEALLARNGTSEMLVLGSRGHGAVTGFLLGSIGMQVLARARNPVVMVRHDAEANPSAPVARWSWGSMTWGSRRTRCLSSLSPPPRRDGPRCVPYGPGICRPSPCTGRNPCG
ncbi:universal stress protein [Streptomyces sp. 7N604]|uniref:universal stress protein n=1 Tax=Streptomyces sp. 7N604 TaxID=3457415 RepID=UPI003FD0F9C4